MPVRNGELYVADAIRSILNQTLVDLELIIVDDGSVDGAPQILAQFAHKDERIRVLTLPSTGIATALESGRAMARGRYIARMDADDVSLRHRFAVQVAHLDAHPSIVALGGQVQVIDAHSRPLNIGLFPIEPAACRAQFELGAPFCHPAVMMRRDTLHHCGGYRQFFEPAEDLDLWLRLAKIGELANLDEIILQYRVHLGAVTISRAKANAAKAALALLSDRFGGNAVSQSMVGSDERAVDWHIIEERLESSYRLYGRAAYLRALILNGGIKDESQFGFLLRSLPEMARDEIVGSREDVLAFMIVRAAYQLGRTGLTENGWRVMRLGTRLLPRALAIEVARSMVRRIRANAGGVASPQHC
jgi:glycosyltransferase involved in cell wall biosynthesis